MPRIVSFIVWLRVNVLNVVIMSVVILNECRYAECCYVEWVSLCWLLLCWVPWRRLKMTPFWSLSEKDKIDTENFEETAVIMISFIIDDQSMLEPAWCHDIQHNDIQCNDTWILSLLWWLLFGVCVRKTKSTPKTLKRQPSSWLASLLTINQCWSLHGAMTFSIMTFGATTLGISILSLLWWLLFGVCVRKTKLKPETFKRQPSSWLASLLTINQCWSLHGAMTFSIMTFGAMTCGISILGLQKLGTTIKM